MESLQFLLSKPPIGSVIFSDSLSAIESIASDSDTSAIHQEIKYCIYQLWCQGVQIVLCWIPSHVGIGGNEMADKLAKGALLHQFVDYPKSLDVSDLNILLENNLLKEWQSKWDSSSKGRFYYKLQPKVSFDVKYSDRFKAKQTPLQTHALLSSKAALQFSNLTFYSILTIFLQFLPTNMFILYPLCYSRP